MTTDNRTNEPTEAQVEAACVAYESTNAFGSERATRMRAALVAAAGVDHECGMHCEGFETGVMPVHPSSTVDEGKIAKVIRHAMHNGYRDWPEGIARAVVEAIEGEGR